MNAPGWPDFDGDIVNELYRGDPAAIEKAPGGGMRCPLVGHDEWLPWDAQGYSRGTQPHGEPSIAFRVSPTYILDDPLENFIAGRNLVAGALNREWQKAETGRLGHENSEDAVSWNVFRSLQEAGQLGLAVRLLTGADIDGEPELILWGRRIGLDETARCDEIHRALDRLEPNHGQQTEPDVVMRTPGWGWIFIEAKLSSPTATYAGKPKKLGAWRERYPVRTPGLFNSVALDTAAPESFPEQLLRNVAVGHAVRESGEQVVVAALVREQYRAAVDGWAGNYVESAAGVGAVTGTWEQLYAALSPSDARLSGLRSYMENKSVGLRRAFALP
jgi:hypothetical protein